MGQIVRRKWPFVTVVKNDGEELECCFYVNVGVDGKNKEYGVSFPEGILGRKFDSEEERSKWIRRI